MKWMQACFLSLCALGVARCGVLSAAEAPSAWLSPLCTKENPYTFAGVAGETVSLPMARAWTVFNARSEASEVPREYQVTAEGDAEYGAGALRFGEGLKNDASAYLSLGIRGSDADDAEPLQLEPAPGNLRYDSIYATVRFVPSDDLPDMETLKQMYPSYEARRPTSGGLPLPVAAKLGICVKQDGMFYITRVRSGSQGAGNTGTAENLVFEFCQSKYSYAELYGGGKVEIQVEFVSYKDPATLVVTRAFRIFAQKPDGSERKCLTEARGYKWEIDPMTNRYDFDFDSLEAGDEAQWMYAIDNACAGVLEKFSSEGLDSLQQLGFSATDGGFYSAWVKENTSVATGAALQGADLRSFTAFMSGENFSLYHDWAYTYGVDLASYLPAAGTLSTFDASASTLDEAFDAFLLNMDPAETVGNGALSLTVTGLVSAPEEGLVYLTVCGPAGCDLSQVRAAKVCVRRAETLSGMSTAEARYYTSYSPDTEGNLVFALPYTEEDVEKPFMQVTLVPVSEFSAE